MNAVTRHDPNVTAVQSSNSLMPADMNGAMRLAEMMSTGKLVPTHLQKSPGDCLMVIEQAMRWGMSPFAVAQSTSVIQGKLMFEGKLVAAALQASGILSGRLDYEFEGDGETRVVTVSATLRGEAKPKSVKVAFKEVRTTNGMWTKQPDQQLVYSGTRVWARRFAPEVMLGVYTPEEFDQPRFTGTTIDAAPEVPPTPAPRRSSAPIARPVAPASPPQGDREWDTGQPEYPFATGKGGKVYHTGSEWMEAWRRLMEACARTDALDKLRAALEMNAAQFAAVAEFDPQAVADVRKMVDDALGGDAAEPALPEMPA